MSENSGQTTGGSSSNSHTKHNIIIGVLLGLLIIVVITLIVMISRDRPAEPVPPVEGEPTATPGDVVDTAPLPTQPPLPTEAATPTVIPGDPGEDLGDPTWIDNFDTEDNWDLYDNDCFKSEIKDGKFEMTGKGETGYNITCWEATWPKVHDYYLEVTAMTLDECNGLQRYGLFFRGPDPSKGYVLVLTCDGRYGMANISGGELHMVAGLDESSAINAGPNQTNRIGVIANGSTFNIYINGTLVREASDSAYTGTGERIGLTIGAAEDQNFKVEFDNFAYWDLP